MHGKYAGPLRHGKAKSYLVLENLPRMHGKYAGPLRHGKAKSYLVGSEILDEGVDTALAGIEEPAGAADCRAGDLAALDVGRMVWVVMALSGFSKWSLSGPRPRRIRARESGMVLL